MAICFRALLTHFGSAENDMLTRIRFQTKSFIFLRKKLSSLDESKLSKFRRTSITVIQSISVYGLLNLTLHNEQYKSFMSAKTLSEPAMNFEVNFKLSITLTSSVFGLIIFCENTSKFIRVLIRTLFLLGYLKRFNMGRVNPKILTLYSKQKISQNFITSSRKIPYLSKKVDPI